MPTNLIEYRIALSGGPTGPGGQMYDYQMAGNGVFAVARRPGLEACVPVAEGYVAGLPELVPYVTLTHGRIPAHYLAQIFTAARQVCLETPHESLFWLGTSGKIADGWWMQQPQQDASFGSVIATEADPGNVLVDVHSHHIMDFNHFSPTDDRSESGKFRIFGLLTDIFKFPTIRTRVHVYNHSWEFDPRLVFELPKHVHVADDPSENFRPRRRPARASGRQRTLSEQRFAQLLLKRTGIRL